MNLPWFALCATAEVVRGALRLAGFTDLETALRPKLILARSKGCRLMRVMAPHGSLRKPSSGASPATHC